MRENMLISVWLSQAAAGCKQWNNTTRDKPLDSVWLLNCVDIQAFQSHHWFYMTLQGVHFSQPAAPSRLHQFLQIHTIVDIDYNLLSLCMLLRAAQLLMQPSSHGNGSCAVLSNIGRKVIKNLLQWAVWGKKHVQKHQKTGRQYWMEDEPGNLSTSLSLISHITKGLLGAHGSTCLHPRWMKTMQSSLCCGPLCLTDFFAKIFMACKGSLHPWFNLHVKL
jgi:hypothetical protein